MLEAQSSFSESSQSLSQWLDFESAKDLRQVEELLLEGVRSEQSLPRELSQQLVKSGGKRIRPFLMCLSFRAFLKSSRETLKARGSLEDLHHLAAVSEWVHTATLFHDDVLDASPARRNQACAHITHGNKTAILVGDFVYAEAFALLMDRGLLHPSQRLAQTIKKIVSGELLQHQVSLERSLSVKDYDSIAQAKTGTLFAWCTEMGAWLAGSQHFEAAKNFGAALGYAFQMADDLFDTYSLDPLISEDSQIIEWCESAPPLPIVIAAEVDGKITELWRHLSNPEFDTRTKRKLVLEIQQTCRRQKIVEQSIDKVFLSLSHAQTYLKQMQIEDSFSWSLKIIWQRALEGAALSKLSTTLEPYFGRF